MIKQPRVFVTQYSPTWNFSEAEKYGEVVFLTNSEYRPQPCPPEVNGAIESEIRQRMKEYIPGEDYIALTGSAIPNVIVGQQLAKNGPHRVLKWSNRKKGYELFIINTGR